MPTPPIVISLGGSLVVPESIDTPFVQSFRDLIMRQVDARRRFIIIVGGGRTARTYVEAAGTIDETMTDEDKDWIGIHATRLNAHLMRTVLRTVAHPRINDNPHDFEEYRNCKEPVIIASGWRPGFSTDFDAVMLGRNLGADSVVNLSNIDYVYDKDPRVHADAVRHEKLTWDQYRGMIGDRWTPGMHAPFDPIASRYAARYRMSAIMLGGRSLDNLESYLDGQEWKGTLISPGE